MLAMTHPIAGFSESRHRPITTAALAVTFWVMAAVLVATVHTELDAVSPTAGAVAVIAALLASSYAYTRMVARNSGATHALGLGITWLVLAIITELAVSAQLGRGWYALLGSPDQPLLRNVYLFLWIFAPAIFARQGDNSDNHE